MSQASKIKLADFKSIPMRTFHMSWFAFFLCFFGWFAIPALSPWIKEALGITKAQFVTTSQWAVGSTVIMRLLIGWLCDKIGPRITYAWILFLGAIPVALSGLVNSYESLLIVRIFIGAIGASFVITQYHTTKMFASNIVGTANATSAGWGNLGGGVTQKAMPLLLIGFSFFMVEEEAWRWAMLVPAVLMVLTGFAYLKFTQDTPEGNFKDIERNVDQKNSESAFKKAVSDYRVWFLFLIYGACFGVELLVNSNMVIYLTEDLAVDKVVAGSIAALFGLMNLFARTLGGFFGDKFGEKGGLKGRVKWLIITLFFEGIALLIFSRIEVMVLLIPSMIIFSLFVQMAEGATFSVVPFINKKALGIIAGIVGAGGNVGAVLGMELFKIEGFAWNDAFMYLGFAVIGVSVLAIGIRFSTQEEMKMREEMEALKKQQLKPA